MRCIEARLRLEREKEQQETLILSVIPAHIGERRRCRRRCYLWVSSSVEHEVGNASEGQGNGQVSSHAIARLRRSAITNEEDQRAQGNVSRSVHKEARECHVSVERVALACLLSLTID